MATTQSIDKALTTKFGPMKPPKIGCPLTVSSISQIPAITAQMREARTGSKLKIGPNVVTAEFKAGFYGPQSRYVEQLFLYFPQSGSYDKIADLFGILDRSQLKQNKALARSMQRDETMQKLLGAADKESAVVLAQFGALKKKMQAMGISTSVAKAIQQKLTTGYTRADLAVQTTLTDVDSLLKTRGDENTFLKERVVGALLIAESFRYPPMLFYSLIILHLFVNGQIGADEINSLHPATKKGAQRTLILSYIKDSEGIETRKGEKLCALDVTAVDDEERQRLEESKVRILEALYLSLCADLENSFFTEAKFYECVSTVFTKYVYFYLNMCGISVGGIGRDLKGLCAQFQAKDQKQRGLLVSSLRGRIAS